MPDVDRNIAAPTRQLFLAAHAKAKRAAVMWILEQAMRLVNLVSDGIKAVQAIIRWTYDAALTSIRLRNIDGADTTAAIRDLPSEHKLTTSYAFVGALKLSNAVNISCFRPERRDRRVRQSRLFPCVRSGELYHGNVDQRGWRCVSGGLGHFLKRLVGTVGNPLHGTSRRDVAPSISPLRTKTRNVHRI